MLHAGQFRKGTTIPYAAHLLAVASIVMEAGGTEDEAIAALLHDGPEDQGGLETLADIRRRFGPHVADIVEHCSDTFQTPKPPWEERKRAYVARLREADASTKLVSLGDKVHNARATVRDLLAAGSNPMSVWGRFSAKPEQTVANYRALLGAYNEGVDTDPRRSTLINELAHLIGTMEQSLLRSNKP